MAYIACPFCHGEVPGKPCTCNHRAPYPIPTPIVPVAPQGCICPPTSERTCQSPNCPRRG